MTRESPTLDIREGRAISTSRRSPVLGVFCRSSSISWTFLLFIVLNASELSNRDSRARQKVDRLANQHVPAEIAPVLAIRVQARWRRKRQHVRYKAGSCLLAW
jgi:hypothetical protein